MSTIIIRLQNLPLSAKAADIREFFGDLKIPKGSVNIVGGPHGDAFIGFSTDEDARLAMLLDGRLLHNAKIHLMLSSKREMQDVIAAAQAQAQAIKSGRDPAATQAQNNQQLNGSTKSESITSKAEVAEPSSTGQIQQMYDGSQLPQQLLPPSFPQLFQQPPIAATQSPMTFSGDSWKNPQQQHQTSGFGSPQINVAAGQQQTTQLVGQTSPQQSPVFPTSMPPPSQFTMPPPQIPQHQYQQLPTPQLPGFPPPIGQQPPPIGQSQIPPIGGYQQPPPNLSRLPFMNPPPQLQSTGNNDKFFNQPPQQHSGASPRFPPAQFGGNNQPVSQQQFFGRPAGGIQGQQQQFGGRSTGPQGIHGNFRQNQQQQFGRRTPNQTGAGQRPQQQQFGVQQRPTGNFRPNFGQQQRFGGQNQQQNQQQFGLKRQRSRSPNMDQGANKRFNFPMSNDNTGFAGQGQKQHFPQRQEKQRICIQLSNVPYKATYNDIQDYLSTTKTKCIKCTRVYMPDRNYSDRWIVEFDNEEAAREVCKYQGEIAGRTIRFKIRAERITPRRADEQYAVMEPEEKDKDNGGNDRRSRRDRDGRRESRDGNRSRSNGNRDRSRGNMNRGNDHDRPSSREKNQDRSHDRSKSRGRKRSKSQEGRRTNTEERGDNRQKRNSPNKEDVLPSNQPIPLNASLGSFLFPQANQQNVCNSKSGGTAQLGLTEGIKPIPLRSTPQFFPTISSVPPPSLVSTFIGGNNNNGNGHVQSPTEEQQLFHQQSQPAFNSSWPSKKSATGANAMPLGQRTNASSGPCAISSVPPTPTFNCSDLSFESTIGSSGPALIIDTDGEGDLDGDDIGAAVNRNEDIDRSVHTGISHDQKPTNAAASIFGTSATLQALSSIPDQPPLDLLEPIDDNKPVDQKHFNASQLQLFPPSSSESRLPSFLAPNFSLDERPLFDSKPVLTPNIGSNEFSQQEVELRPHLQFLNNYKVDPNLKSCLRLENVPKMVFVDQLSDFLGTKINVPSQNIARMFNGVLYINLDNELFAIKAASRNGQFLSGSQIGITQLRKCEMADAIRQNMIIIREMYRVMVVVRGFPLNAQQNEVIALFERFNVNRDAIEKCAVRNSDSHSAFILTFPSTQDCQNAVRELNGVQISGGIRLEVFQPEKFGI